MKNKAILCVDDEVIILAALKQELKSGFGDQYIIEAAMDADEAMAVLKELSVKGIAVRLIITDWLMPGIKGDELLINIKGTHPEIKSIMITGQADDAAIQRAKNEAGVHTVMGKPWSKEELFSAINGCLNVYID